MNLESPVYNFIATGLSLIGTFVILWFAKTDRQHFLIDECSNRDRIAQLILNENGKFQVVDVDSVLLSDKEWDDVVVINEDARAKDGKPLNYNGLILRYQKIFLKEGNEWWLSDISLKSMQPIEYCDSIESFYRINNDTYARLWYGNLVGLIKATSGEKVIPPNYKELIEDSNKNFIVKDKNDKYGLLDLQGNQLVETKYESISKFSGEIYLASIANERNLYLSGYKRYSCVDCSIGAVGTNYAVRKLDGYQLLNSSLSFQSPLLEDYSYLSNDYFSFKLNGLMGVYQFNPNQVKEVIPPSYSSILKESEGYWRTYSQNNKIGLYYLDREIIPAQFDEVDLSGNYVFVESNGRWGLWDSHNQREWVSPTYRNIEILSGDLLKVNDGNGIGLLKKSDYFYTLIKCQYSDITDRGSYYETEKNGRKGVADYNGNEILAPVFSQIERNSNSDIGVYFVATRNGWNYLLDANGSAIIPEKYSFIEIQGASLALIRDNYNDYGWYNLKNQELQIACNYQKVEDGFSYQADIVKVYDGTSWYNIDYYGNKREGSAALNKAENLLDQGVNLLEEGIDAAKNFFK